MSDHMTQYTEGHTVRAFDAELEQLRTLVLQMGGLVIDQLQRAVERYPQTGHWISKTGCGARVHGQSVRH